MTSSACAHPATVLSSTGNSFAPHHITASSAEAGQPATVAAWTVVKGRSCMVPSRGVQVEGGRGGAPRPGFGRTPVGPATPGRAGRPPVPSRAF
ncbi:hypothetical protein GCM10010515_25470 [Streptomyces fructofermentans]|uniref:Uncharacterized protein n=1 Tax=Streptomyces fructofermentans TaxID=152141 RepID=A0A918KBV3_9ACTN|nr:hypothetical protein GCM10010515_25470 [Streptomyces fructofermentans]